jgi:D-alanine-D-alanine ligase
MSTGLRVGLTYDLRDDWLAEGYSELDTAEFDRVDTIDSIAGTLADLGYVPERVGNLKQLAARLVAGERWDLVFNICEGMHGIGREAQVPALLDAYGIPYVFSDPLVCALTLHKGMTKRVVRDAGVRTPEFAVVADPADLRHVELPFPLFAKPVAEGTGKGVTTASRVENRRQLQRVVRALLREFHQPVLIERFLPGREFTVGILGTGQAATALATLEIVLLPEADANVYSYRNKEQCEELVRYQLLEEDLMRRDVEQLALEAWQALGCRDGGRIDIRLDQHGAPHFLEVNPLAGIHPEHSDLPIMATLVGVSYRDLIARIMDSALGRIAAAQARPARVAA